MVGVALVEGKGRAHPDAGELHAYYRIDDRHLKDAGKLKLRTGRYIRCHYLSGGATGRVSITLEDWDLDGVPDLILGVPRHASVPEPEMAGYGSTRWSTGPIFGSYVWSNRPFIGRFIWSNRLFTNSPRRLWAPAAFTRRPFEMRLSTHHQ